MFPGVLWCHPVQFFGPSLYMMLTFFLHQCSILIPTEIVHIIYAYLPKEICHRKNHRN